MLTQTEVDWLGGTMRADPSIVPCGSCSACCRSVVDIHPEHGDDPKSYDCVVNVDVSAANQLATVALRRVPDRNGDLVCTYLDHGRCTIWERRPWTCRTFDCRKLHAILTRQQERLFVKEGYFENVVFKAGRSRRHSLPEFKRLRELGRTFRLGETMFKLMQARRGFW